MPIPGLVSKDVYLPFFFKGWRVEFAFHCIMVCNLPFLASAFNIWHLWGCDLLNGPPKDIAQLTNL